MNTHADKTETVKGKPRANEPQRKRNSGNAPFQFIDKRPAAGIQSKLGEIANSSIQAKQLSAFQKMANGKHRQNQPIQRRPAFAENGRSNSLLKASTSPTSHNQLTPPQQLATSVFTAAPVTQLASKGELIEWSQAFADSAVFEDAGMKSDYVILHLNGQTVGGGPADLEFHIHVPGGEVARAYAGSLFEVNNRDDGELQSQDEGTMNSIVTRWKESMAASEITMVRTPKVAGAEAAAAAESAAKEALVEDEAEIERLAALAEPAAEVEEENDEEFVARLLPGKPAGLIRFELGELRSGKHTRASLLEYYQGVAERKADQSHTASGSWLGRGGK